MISLVEQMVLGYKTFSFGKPFAGKTEKKLGASIVLPPHLLIYTFPFTKIISTVDVDVIFHQEQCLLVKSIHVSTDISIFPLSEIRSKL